MNSKNTNNAGFSLIELVVVIVLLAILVTVAVSKFISLKSDSKAAHLQTIAGAMEGGLSLINSNAIIHGENIGTGQIIINGTTVSLYNGYPSVRGRDSFADINAQVKAWVDIDIIDRNTARFNRNLAPNFTDKSSAQNKIYIFFTSDFDQKGIRFKCHVLYSNPETTLPVKPTIIIETDDC